MAEDPDSTTEAALSTGVYYVRVEFDANVQFLAAEMLLEFTQEANEPSDSADCGELSDVPILSRLRGR